MSLTQPKTYKKTEHLLKTVKFYVNVNVTRLGSPFLPGCHAKGSWTAKPLYFQNKHNQPTNSFLIGGINVHINNPGTINVRPRI